MRVIIIELVKWLAKKYDVPMALSFTIVLSPFATFMVHLVSDHFSLFEAILFTIVIFLIPTLLLNYLYYGREFLRRPSQIADFDEM